MDVGAIGKAIQDYEQAACALDRKRVPNVYGDNNTPLTLSERVEWLTDLLADDLASHRKEFSTTGAHYVEHK